MAGHGWTWIGGWVGGGMGPFSSPSGKDSGFETGAACLLAGSLLQINVTHQHMRMFHSAPTPAIQLPLPSTSPPPPFPTLSPSLVPVQTPALAQGLSHPEPTRGPSLPPHAGSAHPPAPCAVAAPRRKTTSRAAGRLRRSPGQHSCESARDQPANNQCPGCSAPAHGRWRSGSGHAPWRSGSAPGLWWPGSVAGLFLEVQRLAYSE
eukprot:353633-Chlamydomonas_euryale.AAC.2